MNVTKIGHKVPGVLGFVRQKLFTNFVNAINNFYSLLELSMGPLALEVEPLTNPACDLVQSSTLDKADMSLWVSI